MTAIMVPLIIYGMVRVKRHYNRIHTRRRSPSRST